VTEQTEQSSAPRKLTVHDFKCDCERWGWARGQHSSACKYELSLKVAHAARTRCVAVRVYNAAQVGGVGYTVCVDYTGGPSRVECELPSHEVALEWAVRDVNEAPLRHACAQLEEAFARLAPVFEHAPSFLQRIVLDAGVSAVLAEHGALQAELDALSRDDQTVAQRTLRRVKDLLQSRTDALRAVSAQTLDVIALREWYTSCDIAKGAPAEVASVRHDVATGYTAVTETRTGALVSLSAADKLPCEKCGGRGVVTTFEGIEPDHGSLNQQTCDACGVKS